MSVKFAGARSVDDRRRRRLASENDAATNSPLGPKHPQAGYLKIRRFEPNSVEPPRSPIASLITPSSWRIWAACLCIPIFLLLLQLGSLLVNTAATPALEGIIDPEQGSLWRFVRGLTLLGCAGLCWLISWFRSASVRDFDGCFKSWYWSGWIFLLLGLAAGTDAHLAFGAAVTQYSQLQMANLTTLVWCTPLLSMLGEPFRCFVREMWNCRRSWLGLCGCCLSGILFLWARLEGFHSQGFVSPETLAHMAWVASVMTPTLLFVALLSQVHYVMYVSSDPVAKRQSWLIQRALWLIQQSFRGMSQALRLFCSTTVSLWNSLRAFIVRRQETARLEKERRSERNKLEKTKPTKKTRSKETEAESTTPRNSRKTTKNTTSTRSKSTKTTTRKGSKSAETETMEETAEVNSEPAESVKPTVAEKPRVRVKAKTQNISGVESTAAPPSTAEKSKSPSTSSTKVDKYNTKDEEAEWQELLESEARQNSSVTPASKTVAPPVAPATVTLPQTSEEEESWEDEQGEDGLDAGALKGLSKKERRKLRKQHRDQQRAKAG